MNSAYKVRNFVLAVVALLAVVSGMTLFSQGGFGGGHGKFDRLLFILGLPWDWIVSQIRLTGWPEWLLEHDIVWLVAVPFAFNVSVVFLGAFLTNTVIGLNKNDGSKSSKISAR